MDHHAPVGSTVTLTLERTVRRIDSRLAMLLLLPVLLTITGPVAAGSAAVSVTSEAGVDPELWENGGGNVACSELAPPSGLLSEQLEYNSNSKKFKGKMPDGFDITVDGHAVSWSSEWPITAVIVKGSNASHVYRYAPARVSDAGLVPPINQSGEPADVGHLTFCWLEGDDGDDGDDGDGPIVQVSCDAMPGTELIGPFEIHATAIDETHEGASLALHTSGQVEVESLQFESDEPVAGIIVVASDPVVHAFEHAVTSGAVDLSIENEEGVADVYFCVFRTATNGGGGGGDTVTPLAIDTPLVQAQAPLPTEIASGEGPSPRTSLGLVALTMLALAATRWRSAWHG